MKKINSNVQSWLSEKTVANLTLATVIYYLVFSILNNQATYSPREISVFLFLLLPILFTDSLKMFLESLLPSKLYTSSENISEVSVIIPTYNGGATLSATLESLLKRFPAKSIIVSSNGSTDNTMNICKKYKVTLVDIPAAVGKVEAINIALKVVKTPYTLIMDDDVILGGAKLPTGILKAGYSAVAFRVLPIKDNWLTLLQLHEYRKSMDIGRAFHNTSGSVQNVSGAIGLFPTAELIKQIDKHTGEFSGEDLQRTLLLHMDKEKRTKGVVICDSIVETDVPNRLDVLYKQRIFGWCPGMYSNYFKYLKLIFKKNVPMKLRYEAFFSTILIVLLEPLRLLSIPVIFINPLYGVYFYLIYLVLETIPWHVMGRHEPYWVIIIYPFYGLFNFLTRIVALPVFFYRRLATHISRFEKLDEYKKARIHARGLSIAFTSVLYSLILFSYSHLVPDYIFDHKDSFPAQKVEKIVEAETIVSESQKNITTETVTDEPVDYVYTATTGSSLWKLSKKAVERYIREEDLSIDTSTKNLWIYNLSLIYPEKNIQLNNHYTFNKELVRKALLPLNIL